MAALVGSQFRNSGTLCSAAEPFAKSAASSSASSNPSSSNGWGGAGAGTGSRSGVAVVKPSGSGRPRSRWTRRAVSDPGPRPLDRHRGRRVADAGQQLSEVLLELRLAHGGVLDSRHALRCVQEHERRAILAAGRAGRDAQRAACQTSRAPSSTPPGSPSALPAARCSRRRGVGMGTWRACSTFRPRRAALRTAPSPCSLTATTASALPARHPGVDQVFRTRGGLLRVAASAVSALALSRRSSKLGAEAFFG